MADKIKIRNAINFYQICWYIGIFGVTGYKSVVKIIKFKMADKN